ncbi:MAG: ABC transporter ATP-binding protein [Candidatus Xenobium sp.]|jgi:Fe-S cluster assembly ATP-binding protein|nr:ATP-binding cassette domain-containing protein [Burkholderiales bacterium]
MLELRNLSVTLDNGKEPVEVLHDISLSLKKNKIYVMTGPNGGGKSSIAKAIMGIYPASKGQILLEGEDITSLEIYQRARLGIGYAFQQPPRFKGLQVRDFLTLAGGPDTRVNPCNLLLDVGLCAQDYLDREMDSGFSGGELKRVEIASILARRLKVAVFDEPEAGIDLWSFQKLTETFRDLHQRQETTLVIISHQERILRLADEVILVSGGRIANITNCEEILGDISRTDSDCLCRQECNRKIQINVECHR